MRKRPSKHGEKLLEQDIDLLISLYEERAMTTQQLSRRHNYSVSHMYKKTQKLRKEGYILTHTIKGYIPGKKRQGDYHRISAKGISLLKEINYPVEYEADDLRVNQYRLPYLLSTNDLLIDMERYGWDVIDSREIKERHDLNRGANLHGALFSPDERVYPFYIFIGPVSIKNLNKIVQEVSSYEFPHMIMFTKSRESFDQVLESFSNNSDIVKYRTFRVLPYGFAKYYLPFFDNTNNLMGFLSSYGVEEQEVSNIFRLPDGLRTVVKHEGEEKFLINLLDNDLKKIYQIKNYRKEHYETDGRRVLVVTHMKETHKELLQYIHHIDYLEIDYSEIQEYTTRLPVL